ncbi:MAG: hypothetical protein KKB13_27470 [Chloroflexi bacterium]|nr:hypothetical protein [Chloroflexota bacterium]
MFMRRGQPTPTARRVRRLVGIVGALLVLGILGLAGLLLAQPDEPVPLAPGPPALTPLVTPLAASDRPTTWTVQLTTHPATGRPEGVVDDARVYRMVRDDYLAGEGWFMTQAVTLTQLPAEALTAQLAPYFGGPRLHELAGLVAHFRDQGRAYTVTLTTRQIEVRNFAADGQQVYLGDSWAGGTVTWYALDGGTMVAAQDLPAGLVMVTMRYDPELGRWREAAVRVPAVAETTSPGGRR